MRLLKSELGLFLEMTCNLVFLNFLELMFGLVGLFLFCFGLDCLTYCSWEKILFELKFIEIFRSVGFESSEVLEKWVVVW